MLRYQNGKIYKITDNNNNLTYYGSTIDTLEKRLKSHIDSYHFQTKNC